ncbi:MAG: hypothetical protein EAZ27_01705 [Cytophagales bacterium]|nr:MAG: hypothetical protein EAZ27_01705 [Cytophagales bacterium]
MVEKIEFKNSSNKLLEVIVEPDADSFNLEPKQKMLIYIENVRFEYKDEFAFEHDGCILTIHQPRQSNIEIFINEQKIFYFTPGRPMWKDE